jgi:ribokinase
MVARVVVAGGINMDVVASAPHHPAVGETVLGTDLRFVPGGKGANQAVAAVRLGPPTALVGNVGADAFGDSLLAFLSEQGLDLAGVRRHPDAPTGTALIVVGAQADNTIVVVPGANATLTVDDVSRIELSAGDIVVAQYEIPLDVVEAVFARARDIGASTILNPAPAQVTSDHLLGLADFVVLNESELAFLTGRAAGDPTGTESRLRGLRRFADQVVIATLGADGAVAVVGSEVVRIAGRHVDAVDATGAGDCFVGALAASLVSGAPIAGAVRFANAAASLSVQRFGAGTSMPSLAEVTAITAITGS